jgi:hypothetical protein
MDKLVEREAGARSPLSTAPAIAVQFFLIPLLVVGATVLVSSVFAGCSATIDRQRVLPTSGPVAATALAGSLRAVA